MSETSYVTIIITLIGVVQTIGFAILGWILTSLIRHGKQLTELAIMMKDVVVVALDSHKRRLDKGSEKFDRLEDRVARVETKCQIHFHSD